MRTPSQPSTLPPSGSGSASGRRRSTINSTISGGVTPKATTAGATLSVPAAAASAVSPRSRTLSNTSYSNRPQSTAASKPGSAKSLASSRSPSNAHVVPGDWASWEDMAKKELAEERERDRERELERSVDSLTGKRLYFESQQIAPAPGQTYFQLYIREGDGVILRDWPRQRMSQKWTRGGSLNPGATKLTLAEFIGGEMSEKLIWIFGQDVYNEAHAAATKALQDENVKKNSAASRRAANNR